MALPAGFPPPAPSSGLTPPLNVYHFGTTTNAFDDNAILFAAKNTPDAYTATPQALPGTVTATRNPMGSGPRWAYGVRIQNTSANPLHISFDGVHVHGLVQANKEVTYLNRRVAGIAFKSGVADSAASFILEAW